MDFISLYQISIFFILYGILISFCISLFFVDFLKIRNQFKVKKKTWIILSIIFVVGTVLRLFIFPHVHLMYIDEPLYLEQAKNFNEKLQPVICSYERPDNEVCSLWITTKVPAWPFILSIAYSFFDTNSYIAFYLSSILGSISILFMFFFSYLLFKKERVALWSAFLLAVTPLFIIWSNSAETNAPSLFFILVTMTVFMILKQSKNKTVIAPLCLLTLFGILIRFENILVLAILIGTLFFSERYEKNEKYRYVKYYLFAFTLALLLCIVAIQRITLPFFRPLFFSGDFNFYIYNFFPFLKAVSFNYIYLVLPLFVGYLNTLKKKSTFDGLCIAFVALFVLYLPIAFESRMALIPGAVLILLTAVSIEEIRKRITKKVTKTKLPFYTFFVLVIVAFGASWHFTNETFYANKHAHFLQTQVANQLQEHIEDSCYLIAEIPLVYSPTMDNVILSTAYALENKKEIEALLNADNCVYYIQDTYCSRWPPSPLPVPGAFERCQEINEVFMLSSKKDFWFHDQLIALKVINKVTQKSFK